MIEVPPDGMDYDEFLAKLRCEGRSEDEAEAEGQRLVFEQAAVDFSMADWKVYPLRSVGHDLGRVA